MRSRSTRWALCAVLLLQLALGMPGSFALAALTPAATQSTEDGGEHCPGDGMALDHAGMTVTAHHASHPGQQPPSNHGCCHGGACQCHCTYPPAISEHQSLTGPIAVFMHRLPACPTPLAAAPPGERFRPPIV